MKNFKNKLFTKFELNKPEAQLVVGGLYSDAGTDTVAGGAGNYDIVWNSGESSTDTINCMPGSTIDKPISEVFQ